MITHPIHTYLLPHIIQRYISHPTVHLVTHQNRGSHKVVSLVSLTTVCLTVVWLKPILYKSFFFSLLWSIKQHPIKMTLSACNILKSIWRHSGNNSMRCPCFWQVSLSFFVHLWTVDHQRTNCSTVTPQTPTHRTIGRPL